MLNFSPQKCKAFCSSSIQHAFLFQRHLSLIYFHSHRMMWVLKADEDEPPSLTVWQCGVWRHPPHVVNVSFDELCKQTKEHKISCTEWKRDGQRRHWRAAHHGGSSARLQAAQPGHVNGRPGAAVGVGRAAVQRAEVIPCVHYQEIIRPVTEHKLNLHPDWSRTHDHVCCWNDCETHPLTSVSASSSIHVSTWVARMEDTSSSWMSWVEAITKQLRLAWKTKRGSLYISPSQRSNATAELPATAPYWWRTPWWCQTPCGWCALFLLDIPDQPQSEGEARVQWHH